MYRFNVILLKNKVSNIKGKKWCDAQENGVEKKT
jgi:hypothetical protein